MPTPKVYTPIEVRNMTAAQFAAYTPNPDVAAEPIFITDTKLWAVATPSGKYLTGGGGDNEGCNVIDASNTTSAFSLGTTAALSKRIQIVYDNATAGTRGFTLPASTLNGNPLKDGDTFVILAQVEGNPPYASAQTSRYVDVSGNLEGTNNTVITLAYGHPAVTFVWNSVAAKWRCLTLTGGTTSPGTALGIGAVANVAGVAVGRNAKAVASGGGASALGLNSLASGNSSTAMGSASTAAGGGSNALGTNSYARLAYETALGPRLQSNRVAPDNRIPFGVQTTNATQTVIGLGGTANLGAVLVADSAMAFSGIIVARQEGGNRDSKMWEVKGMIVRDNAGNTSFVGTPSVTAITWNSGAAAWALAVNANNTTESLELLATGEASKTINWGGHLVIVQAGAAAIQ